MKTFNELKIGDALLIDNNPVATLCYKVSDIEVFNTNKKDITTFNDEDILSTDIIHTFTCVTSSVAKVDDIENTEKHETPMLWEYPIIFDSFRNITPGTFFTPCMTNHPICNSMCLKIDNCMFIDFAGEEIGYVELEKGSDKSLSRNICSKTLIIREEEFKAFCYIAKITQYINNAAHPKIMKYMSPVQVEYVRDLVRRYCTENILPGKETIALKARKSFETDMGHIRTLEKGVAYTEYKKRLHEFFDEVSDISELTPSEWYAKVTEYERREMHKKALHSSIENHVITRDGASYDFDENIINKLSE